MLFRSYFTDVLQKGDEVRFVLYEKANIDVANIPGFVDEFYGALRFTPDAKGPYFTFRMNHSSKTRAGHVLDVVRTVLDKAETMLLPVRP